MEHITVLNNKTQTDKNLDCTPLIVNQTYGVLTSLIDAFSQKDFGYDTTLRTSLKIRNFKKHYIEPIEKPLFIDSSGYSIIVGDVARWDIAKVIGCYHEYLYQERDTFDYIFSLDIPFNLNFPLFNTSKNVYFFNRQSLMRSRDLLIKHPELADKFYYIYQFKCKALYEVWSCLYKELELGKVIKNWAIGGMVGIKRLAKIDISSFIGIIYKILFDYINSKNPNPIFRVHFLGIYQRQERFQIAFIEQLFKSYFNGSVDTLFTYDSINYIRQAQNNATKNIHDFNQGIFGTYSINDMPLDIIQKVYFSDIYQNSFYSQLERKMAGKKVADTNVFAPLNIYSNISIDKLFQHVIIEYNMIDTLKRSISTAHIEVAFNKIFKALQLQYPLIFTKDFSKAIIENLQVTLKFHQWYHNTRDETLLNELILSFIKILGIPDMLKEFAPLF